MKFEEPMIKVVCFETPCILTVSTGAYDSNNAIDNGYIGSESEINYDSNPFQ